MSIKHNSSSHPPKEDEEIVINSEDFLLRRITQHHIVFDTKTNEERVSTAAFTHKEEISIDIKKLAEADKDNIIVYYNDQFVQYPQRKDRGILEFSASTALALDLDVKHDPVEGNPYHGAIIGKITKSKAKEFISNSSWLIPIKNE